MFPIGISQEDFLAWVEKQEDLTRNYDVPLSQDCPLARFLRQWDSQQPSVGYVYAHLSGGFHAIPLPGWAQHFIRKWDASIYQSRELALDILRGVNV